MTNRKPSHKFSPRFHGRFSTDAQCAHPGCHEAGEFRAPAGHGPSFDGPGGYRWLCLDHIRAFNAGYDYFAGMTPGEILAAQHPIAGWERATRAFADETSVDQPPKWANFADPLDAISARFAAGVADRMAERAPKRRAYGTILSTEDATALKILGLDADADRKTIRAAYSRLLRAYHPDKNGGDRAYEKKLQAVVDAYARVKRLG